MNIDPLPPGAAGVVTIDLGAIAANWRLLKEKVGPHCGVGAAVKANGYGLGMIPVSTALAKAGCRWFFVATIDEGIALASAFEAPCPEAHVAVLSGPSGDMAQPFKRFPALMPVLNDLGQIAWWRSTFPGGKAILHLDTGMARLGLPPDEVAALADDPALLDGIELALVMSHLACADDPDHKLNAAQLARFEHYTAMLTRAPRSLAASSGIFLGADYHFDLVRAGAALYGVNPTPGQPNPMRQVFGIKAKILQVRNIDPGEAVGYGATYSAPGPRRIATIGIGYGDGIPRTAGNHARCQVGAVEVPIIGRISMDLTILDVSAAPELQPGAFVDVIGPHYDVDDLARDSGTIAYEVMTRLGSRLHRVYQAAA